MSHLFRTPALAGALALSLSTAATAASIEIRHVTFQNGGETLAGDLYVPDDGQERARPAVVVTGAWMTVKEQMAGRYAREMADRGLVALAFDFRGWGQSGGRRRQFEDPQAKISDIEAAAAFLAARPEAEKDRIGGLGICASSGYMATAAAETSSIRSVAFVAPWLHDHDVVEQTYGGADGVARLETRGDAANAEYLRTGQQSFVPAASTIDAEAIMHKAPYYTDPNRGMIAAWRNQADPSFWRGWLTFDAMQAAPRLTQPFLMVHSEAAAIPQGAHKFYAQVKATKREIWFGNVTQFDFYDQPGPVSAASDAVANHFRHTLGTTDD